MVGLHVTTLGCKLNQFDSAELAGALRGAVALVEDPVDARLVVVNTCTVTGAADSDARQILRRRRRESPNSFIVATGCYAEREPGALGALAEVDLVLGREQRPRAAEIILEHLRRRFPAELSDGCADRVVGESLPDFGCRSRAYLRVQEGCDLRCSYCVIPAVRGASRSTHPGEVERRLRTLLAAGYREVVLTGVNTGDYGKDLGPRTDLVRLLERLIRIEERFRIRLNSVEPRCIVPPLVDLMASEPRLARHLQVPLQSGSDAVLRRMRRNYRTQDYRRIVDSLRERMPDIGIGADVIVGFPGESDSDFEKTVRLLEESPVNYLHVFSYSSRPGTDAASIEDPVPPEEIKRRSRELRALGRRLAARFRRSQEGTPLEALVMRGPGKDGRARALTHNFIEVALPAGTPENSLLDVVIDSVDSSGRARARLA